MGDRGPSVSPTQPTTRHRLSSTLPAPAYWNAEQLASYLNRPVKTVYKWPDTYPDMPCVKLGRVKMFPIERVIAWLRTQEQGRRSRQKKRAASNPTPTNGTVHD
jgi:hypothetical protein